MNVWQVFGLVIFGAICGAAAVLCLAALAGAPRDRGDHKVVKKTEFL